MEKIKFNLNYISIFFLLCFPLFLVVGTFLAEVSMNLINIIFLYNVFKNRKFEYFKDKFFIFFILFYFYILFTLLLSNYFEQIYLKHIFYVRHIIFTFAIVDLLKQNKYLIFLFYKVLALTIFIVAIDGVIQFFFDFNSLGFKKIRPDRLTGFFDDKMILGSYLSRFLPLLIALFFLNFNSKKLINIIFGITIIVLSFITIVLSGERMAFYTTFIYIISLIILLNYSILKKILSFLIIILITSIIFLVSPTIVDRHYQQTKDQLKFNLGEDNIFANFLFYKDIYTTAFNGYLDSKIFGQGARSFRFFCSEKKLASYSVSNYIYDFKNSFSKEKLKIINVYKKRNDNVLKNDIIFTYVDKKEVKNFYLAHDVKILDFNLTKGSLDKAINTNDIVFHYSITRNGCTTHPHNFYLQLLSETGIFGFLFIVILFIYLVYLILKNFMSYFLQKKPFLNNFQICLLLGFIITLLPMIPNGNFFNNWLSMIMFFPAGFYIFSKKKDNK